MGSPLPLSSLRLLVPPMRLMSAYMWQVVQQQKLEHFNELEEYVILITKIFPQILSDRQKNALVMGLRAKVILEMCKGEVPIDQETVKERLQTIESKDTFSEVGNVQCRLLKLLLTLLEDPNMKEHFFQEVFPVEYGPEFDKALQVLVGHFLSRLEQLLPVPNFKQVAMWLSTTETDWESLVQSNWNPRFLLPLLRNDYQGTLETNGLPSVVEDRIISTLSLSLLADVAVPSESYTDIQSEPSLCLESSSQDVDQDISQQNKTDGPELEIFFLNQVDDYLEIGNMEEESSSCHIQEEAVLTESAIVCEILETVKMSQSQSVDKASTEIVEHEIQPSAEVEADIGASAEVVEADIRVSAEVVGHEIQPSADVVESDIGASAEVVEANIGASSEVDQHEIDASAEAVEPDIEGTSEVVESEIEAFTDADRPDPSSVLSGKYLISSEEGDVETPNKAPSINTGKQLKVVVPRRLVSIVKQVSLPTVSLSRCLTSDSGFVKVDSDVLKTSLSSSSTSSPSLDNPNKTRPTRTKRSTQHKCSECGMSFRSPVELRAHVRKHTEKGPYKCKTCKLNFKTYVQASIHQRNHHSKETYSCAHCDKSFKSMKAWLLHRREHKVKTVHRCTDCGQEYTSLQSLVNHSKVHNHLVSERLPDAFKCIACGQTFNQKIDFVSHMKTHKDRDRADQDKKKKLAPGECRFCGQIFSIFELRNHLKTHSEFRPHQCDHCGKCFATLQSLLAHISNHTGEKPHSCSNCGKKFFTRSHLKSHMRSHSKERPYCCSYCGKCFYSLGNLTIHTRLHTGEKPYVCLECGKAFSSSGCLQVHQRCHTGEKPYPCTVCGRSFMVSSHRTIHMRSHTGHRPFACEICGKTFVRKRCLNEHVYCHSDVKPFGCSVCSKSFSRRGHLKRHMQSHTDDQINENI
ncbi:uncharacterized protein [Hoplias malabaricus]|uniref:uncharacterized protein n=1 Tax=Hoplias malabaricus TaxID=27720 RepID=UPI003461A5CC